MNKNIKLIINYLLGPVLFIVLSYSLYKQIIRQPDLALRWREIRHSWADAGFWLVCGLMIVNWGFEAAKWKRLISPLEQFSLTKAFKSVLAGCSITMLTPNRIGEYGGRIMYVDERHRLKAISLTILGSISQLTVTMLMGSIGLIVLANSDESEKLLSLFPSFLSNAMIYVSIIVTVILLLVYFKVHFFVMIVAKTRFLQRMLKYVEVVDFFTGKQLLRILFLSFFRYLVFILQYVLLLQVMGVEIPVMLFFWVITIFYVAMALLPSVGFIELPIRATASVTLLSVYSSNILGIQAAAFGIWLINLVIPAIIGSLLIFGIKIMKER
ncbi:MAG: flippase-like domain-containing protein [Bacteroidetes bacterium]|nr:flippase-like domain-containing protein [Bacteroidota bacterium]